MNPHQFEGRHDRDCGRCGKPDRYPVHVNDLDRKCADWCGYGCTQKMYDEALWTAQHTAKRLGDGWKAEVFENMGWHSKVVSENGRVSVSPPNARAQSKHYTAYFDKGQHYSASGATPTAAVGAVLAQVRVDAEDMMQALEELDY